jgi:hypothetical protein
MKALSFEVTLNERSGAIRARKVRRARFEARSSLPISAACVVANGMRETLSSLLGGAVVLRLFEPAIPAPHAWPAILRDARLYRVPGKVADAAVVLRTGDAAALAAALFGESPGVVERALSPIECDVVDRTVNAIAANLGAVCGAREGHSVERVATLDGFVTYFELLIEEPVASRVGIALSREPSAEPRVCLEARHLAGVRLTTLASLDLGKIEAANVARLAVGATIPIDPAELRRCSLTAHGRRLARGSCGVRHGKYAFYTDAREAT